MFNIIIKLKKNFNRNLFLIFIITLGVLFRWNGITNGYWYDEWSSFYYSNPNLNIRQIYNTVILEEGAQPLYFIIASKWNYLFGYSPESLRYLSFLSGCLSIFLFLILLKEFSKSYSFIYFAVYLFSANYFLIQFSQESRFYSLSLLLSILNLTIFFRFIKKEKYYYYYILTGILSLLVNIFFILILLSQLIFLLFKKKKNIYYISIIILFILYCIIDYPYINSIFNKSLTFNIQNTINYHFLIGYYFNIFFGSIILGGLVIIFCFFYLKNIKKIINNNMLFCIISIFTTYSLPTIYSLIKNPILRPRYIIFIVPIIIIYFAYTVSCINKKFIQNSIIIFVVLFSIIIFFYSKPIIFKPATYAAFTIIANSKSKFLFIKDVKKDYFNNYLLNLSLAKQLNIRFLNNSEILDKDFFWGICLNNPRFATNSKTDDKNCFLNPHSKSHQIFEIIKVPDYVLILYKKN
jgi:uncharacterized membrane protein